MLAAETRQPAACTVTIVDANGRTVSEGQGFSGGFRSSGVFTKRLPPGRTRIRVTRGFEFKAVEKEIELRAGEVRSVQLELQRQVDLRRRGWFAGDSHVHMVHGEKTVAVDFDQVAAAARAEDLQYLSLSHAWQLDDPTPERLEAELARRSRPDCLLTWNLEAPKNYFKGDAGRCLGHCWILDMRGRTPAGADVIRLLLAAGAADYESEKPSLANFESHSLIHAQGGSIFYAHAARWWTGSWGGQGIYPKRDKMRMSNLAVELPLDTLVGPTFDGLDIITGEGEFAADQKSFQIWSLLLGHGYRWRPPPLPTPASIAPAARSREWRGSTRLSKALSRSPPRPAPPGRAALSSPPGRCCWFRWTGSPRAVPFPPATSLTSCALRPGLPGRRTAGCGGWKSSATVGPSRRCWTTAGQAGLPCRQPCRWWKPAPPGIACGLSARMRNTSGPSAAHCSSMKSRGAPPAPVPARIRVRVVQADSGRPLDATLTEVHQLGPQPQLGAKHHLPAGTGTLTIPATARLRPTPRAWKASL